MTVEDRPMGVVPRGDLAVERDQEAALAAKVRPLIDDELAETLFAGSTGHI
ncbi:hypothetical protein [Streptomyces sp. NPDC058664]|uniref:hypothetical protein n=1 Tax=unclassified Streptomyces TaxID=2593676 RepID=UPI003651CE7F